jgi:large subunit ribosomal protein L21|tara:strand:+ start:174 stop:485 length:312 start_codon:yes stop_codon:yes gene_type:complete
MKFAVLESGSQQIRAEEGSVITVNRLPDKEGDKIEFPVMLISDNDEVHIGTPFLEGASVKGTILSHDRGSKTLVFKYKPKKRYRRKQGHRQEITRVQIDKISA